MVPVILLGALTLGQGAAASTEPRPRAKVGIFDVHVAGLDPNLRTGAIDVLAAAVAATGRFEVVSRSELDAMLGAEKIKDLVGCNEVSCLAEMGLAAGVERVVAGSVSKVEDSLVVSLQLVNTTHATTENRFTLTWRGGAGELPELLGVAAESLLVPARERTQGALRIVGAPPDAVLSVDGATKGMGPTEIRNLAVGVHTLRVEADGYLPFETPVVVRMGTTRQVNTVLAQASKSPFYSRWWFWTGVGAAVAGGVAAAVLARGGSGPASQQPGGVGAPSKGTITFTGSVPTR